MIQMWDDIYAEYKSEITTAIKSGEGNLAFELMHALLRSTWAEVWRICQPGGFVCINIGDATRSISGHFKLYNNHSEIVRSMEQCGFESLPSIIWRKPTNSPTKFMGSGMLPAGAYVTLEHEFILIFRKPGKREFKDDAKDIRRESAIFWEERNRWFSDQWDLPGIRQPLTIKSERKRSAAFPLELARRLILMFSMYGDFVLDPFGGTATTSLAALITGRNSYSLDNDAELVEGAYKSFTKQGNKKMMNDFILGRMNDHLDYVGSKDQLFFRYMNSTHKVPVKTLQEKDLKMYLIKSIRREDKVVTANYQKLGAHLINKSLHQPTPSHNP